jgi:hypothetical protein
MKKKERRKRGKPSAISPVKKHPRDNFKAKKQ